MTSQTQMRGGNGDVLLHASGLSKSYGKSQVVHDFSLELRSGEILGILGPNGAGKTTIVGMLYGFIKPGSGSVHIQGYDLLENPRTARSAVGVVTQENNLDRDFSVEESLIHFAHHYRLLGAAGKRAVADAMERVGLTAFAKQSTESLSGGYQRRFVLARALLNKPKIVFLDEPTTGLDPEARQDCWRMIAELKADGAGVLLTTHYMDEAERLCDRLILIREGRQIDHGSPSALINRIVGETVLEVEGIPEAALKALTARFDIWYRPLGSGAVLPLRKDIEPQIWAAVDAEAPKRLTKRKADLQDVFLSLTGSELSGS
ncbi:MAG: ABC transporter ATP-binding protein [Bdellovibrionota bacterium]